MYRIFIIVAALFAIASLPNYTSAQALYNTGATLNITSGATVYVVGDLTNAATATLNNSGVLNVSGNTLNNGTITSPAGSVLTFSGSSAQTLSGTSPVAAKDVVVNNSAGITIATPLQVDGTMTFISGLITANNASYPVIFTANGSVGGTPTDASHVDGYVQKAGTGAFTFPVGNTARYQPVGVTLSANSAGMTARYYASDAGSATFGTGGSSSTALVAVNRKEYWDLTPAGTASGMVTIYFDGYNNAGISSTSDLRVAHKTGGQWLNEGGIATGTTSAGFITGASISSWSPFTLGSISSASPLPLTLVSISAREEGIGNRVLWQTATEGGIAKYEVERSANARDFVRIGSVAAKGSTASYSFYDEAPLSGTSYYRLRSLGESGDADYSKVVSAGHSLSSAPVVLSAYPNPASDKLTIVAANSIGGAGVVLRDLSGKTVASATMWAGVATIDVRALPAGVYIAVYGDGARTDVLRVSKR